MLDNLRIGIIGSSEVVCRLMKMSVEAGLDVTVMGVQEPAGIAAGREQYVKGDPSSFDDVVAFGRQMDVVAIAEEATNLEGLNRLCEMGVKTYPDPETVALIQDKFLQKDQMEALRLPVVKGLVVTNPQELTALDEEHDDARSRVDTMDSKNGCLKLHTVEAIGTEGGNFLQQEATLEMKKELLITVSRNESGFVECYGPGLLIAQRDRMLTDFRLCPGRIAREVAMSAMMLASRVAGALRLVGTICVEVIVAGNEKLYVNEIGLRANQLSLPTQNEGTNTRLERQLRNVLGIDKMNEQQNRQQAVLDIPELMAHKKYVVNEALKELLCTSGFSPGGVAKSGRRNPPFPATELEIEEHVSKTVVIKYLLGHD
ncbi:MAG: ATP-grasp domain-containing protein [Taibaiella sp.]|nr:ATP-grasp domain-containing protein [Taibaiella sp.]